MTNITPNHPLLNLADRARSTYPRAFDSLFDLSRTCLLGRNPNTKANAALVTRVLSIYLSRQLVAT
jgi:hypothetical protein